MSNPTLQPNRPETSTSQPATAPRSMSRRRGVKVLAGLLLLLLFVVAIAPTILAKTALRNRVARQVTSDLNGTLEIGSASVGWFTPIELRDVTLSDSRGQVIARIPTIKSSRSLLGLLRDRTKLGEFTLHNPTVEIICDKQSSNLEEVLQKYLEDDGRPRAPTRPEVTVRVVGGTLTLRTPDQRPSGEFHNLEATVQVPAARSEPVAVELSADAPGQLRAEIRTGESGRARLVANGVALESLSILIRRFEPDLDLAGSFSADVTAAWDKQALSVEGTLGGKNIAASGPWLNGDRLRFATAELPLKLSIAGRKLQVERAHLISDLGTISATGSIDFAEPL
jgi:translocation and assembly module TamB